MSFSMQDCLQNALRTDLNSVINQVDSFTKKMS
jgi:hypothetical protein